MFLYFDLKQRYWALKLEQTTLTNVLRQMFPSVLQSAFDWLLSIWVIARTLPIIRQASWKTHLSYLVVLQKWTFLQPKSHDSPQAPLAIIDGKFSCFPKDNQTIQISYDHWESPNLKLPMKKTASRKQCWASCHCRPSPLAQNIS